MLSATAARRGSTGCCLLSVVVNTLNTMLSIPTSCLHQYCAALIYLTLSSTLSSLDSLDGFYSVAVVLSRCTD